MSENITEAAADHWDRLFQAQPSHIRDWQESPYIQRRYIWPRITPAGQSSWYGPWMRGYLLEVGCGANGISALACTTGLADAALGVDISAEAIRVSTQRAREHGLHDRVCYVHADVATVDLGESAFDTVMAYMSLHHVLDLERLFTNVRKAKRPHGFFIVNEYVGPDRFQWTEATVREGQRLLDSLGERYRRHGVTSELVETFARPSYAAMVAGDPSEGIRSSAIIPLLETYFEIVDRRPYGGTILHWLLADIIHNFDPDARPEDAAELDRLFAEERRLIEEGVLQDNFELLIVR
jgi:O-antigen biosynthesis protein